MKPTAGRARGAFKELDVPERLCKLRGVLLRWRRLEVLESLLEVESLPRVAVLVPELGDAFQHMLCLLNR